MKTTKKIGRKTEYTEQIEHSCGHKVDYVTLGYKMERKQAAQKKDSLCGKCQLKLILNTFSYSGDSMEARPE